MAPPEDLRPSGFLSRQLATLAVSQVQTPNPLAAARAATWHNTLVRLGVRVPLVAVHDLGLLLSQSQREAQVAVVGRPQILGLREMMLKFPYSGLRFVPATAFRSRKYTRPAC